MTKGLPIRDASVKTTGELMDYPGSAVMTSHYAETLAVLLGQIDRFRRSDLSLDDLKSAIWEAARIVSAHEERALRDALQQAEGRLDMIQFAVDEPGVRAEALKILDAVEAQVKAAISPP